MLWHLCQELALIRFRWEELSGGRGWQGGLPTEPGPGAGGVRARAPGPLWARLAAPTQLRVLRGRSSLARLPAVPAPLHSPRHTLQTLPGSAGPVTTGSPGHSASPSPSPPQRRPQSWLAR